MRDSKHFCCLEDLQRHLSALLSQHDLEHVCLLEKSLAGSKVNLYMTALSNIRCLPPPVAHTKHPDRWTACAGVEWFCRGVGGQYWFNVYCTRREKGPTAIFFFFFTRLTLDQSHHTFSQGNSSPPPSFPLTLRCICSLFHFYSVKGKKKKKKKNKVDKGCPPSSQQGWGWGWGYR